MKIVYMSVVCVLLSACGYKGDLYLPKENDRQTFGVIQTGLGLDSSPNQVRPSLENNPQPY